MKIEILKRETSVRAEINLDGENFRVLIKEGRYGFYIVFPEGLGFDMRKRIEIQNAVIKAYGKP